MRPEENKPLDQNGYYNHTVKDSYDSLREQHGTLTLKNPELESSSRDKKAISDFGASYGFYPVGLSIFSNGVRSNLEHVVNTDIENSDVPIGNENV